MKKNLPAALKAFLLCIALCLSGASFLFAQVTGGEVYTIDNTVSGASNLFPNTNTFNSFTAAAAALNATAANSITLPVTFDVIAGQTFSEAPVNLNYKNASGNAFIVFERRGAGANPLLQGTGGTTSADYVLSVNGGNYYVIDGIDFKDNPSNATPTTQMEAGFALIGACSNNGVSNCVITLNRTNKNNNVGVNVSGSGGNNIFTNNIIQNALNGYNFDGSGDGNVIRKAGTGRSEITNIGSLNTATSIGRFYGINFSGQNDFTVTGTNINNLSYYDVVGGTGSLDGIIGDGSGTTTIDHDTLINLTVAPGSIDSANIGGFYFNGVGQRTIVSNNYVSNLNSSNSGGFTYGVWDAPVLFGADTIYIHDNFFGSLITGNFGTSSVSCGLILNAADYAIYNNTYTNIKAGNGGGLNTTCTALYLVTPFGSVSQLHDNKISDISAISGTVAGIYMGSVSAPYPPVYNNEVSNISCTNGTAIGMVLAASTIAVYNNKVYNISSGSNSTTRSAVGISVSSAFGTLNYNIYNNFVYDIRANSGTQTTFWNAGGGNAVGILLPNLTSAGSVAQVYFNTVYLNGAATSSSQTSSALLIRNSATAAVDAYDIQNNIFDNSYTGGNAVAMWYNNVNTDYQSLASTSDRNLLYGGTPSATHLLFYSKGADSIQNLANYKATLSPREQNSITGDPVFVSGSGTIDAHIQNTSPAVAAANNIPAVTTDIDYNNRPSPTGTNPDIGADEVTTTCTQSIAGTITAAESVVCTGNSGTLTLTGNSGTPIQWQSGTSPNSFSDVTGGSGNTLNTGSLTQSTYYRVIVGTGSCADTTKAPVQLTVPTPLSPGYTFTVSGDLATFISSGVAGASYFTWDLGDGNRSILPNPIHRYADTGYHHVCLTVYDNFNCSVTNCQDIRTTKDTTTCNVVAGTITAKNDTLCYGSAGQLTISGSVGGIQWQSSTDGTNFNDVGGATDTTYNTPGLLVTTFYQVVLGSGSCTATSAIQKLTVLPEVEAGTITARRDTICSGSPGHLTLSGSQGSPIQWQSSTDSINFTNAGGSDTTYTTTGLLVTTFYQVVVGSGSCTATSAVHKFVVPPILVADFTSTKNGLQVTFNSGSSLGHISAYSWDFGDGASSTDGNPVNTFATGGTYNVCLTIYDGSNCSFTSCKQVTVTGVGVPDIDALGHLSIYPSPFSDNFTVSVLQGNDRIENVQIYDVLGKLVFAKNSVGLNAVQVNGTDLRVNEIYYVKVKTTNAEYVVKVVKE